MAQTRTLSEHFAAFRRRKLPMGITFACLLVASILLALLWPPTYRSTGVILIEQQEIPTDFVRSAVSSYADQRVQTIGQRVMTSTNLLAIINKFDLYADRRATEPREELLERMREDIRLDMISADVVDPRQGRPVKATIAFSVSYDNRSPEVAAQVANEITSLYLRENVESRQRLAAGSASFLADEATRIGRRVSELDQQIAGFKVKHGENLPEFSQINMQLMNRAEDEMSDVDARLRALDQQLVFLDAQLAQIDPASQLVTDSGARVLSSADRLKVVRTQYTSARAVYGPAHPDVIRMEQEIKGLEAAVSGVDSTADLQRQLTDASVQLAAARERYSASHPDVQRLEQLVAVTEQELQRAPAASARAAQAVAATPDNPAFIQIQSQRAATINERDSLAVKKQQLVARIHGFERRFATSPGIERDYMALLRDLQGEQSKYAEVRQKQMEAQLASNLESESKGERFQLIEPPLEAQKPASPNRALILTLGIVLSLAAAFGVLLGLETFDTRVRGRGDIIALLQVPPLVIVPWVETAAEQLQARKAWRHAALGVAGSVIAAAVLIHLFVRPLDSLWFATLRRLT